jgi:hypothetical protein
MKAVDRVYVAGYRHDVRFTRACVASLRRWHPDVPVTLIKDRWFGDYDTLDIERHFGCDVWRGPRDTFGWGFGKLEPLFGERPERFLVIDSDILFVGPALDHLARFDGDFVVQREDDTAPEFVATHYFDLARLQSVDPGFRFPGFTFNTGQWVGQSGLLSPADFEPWVEFASPPRLKDPETFKLGEQGLLNYLLIKGAAGGRWTLDRDRIMEVGSNPQVDAVRIADLGPASPHRFLIHWCGLRAADFGRMVRSDLWDHFERDFYARVPGGKFKRLSRIAAARAEGTARRMFRALVPRRR